MIRLSRPSHGEVSTQLRLADPNFSYPEIGATADPIAIDALASRYAIDRRQFSIGRGRALFARARTALFAWRQFEIPWLELHGADHSAHDGQVVATLTRELGIWFLNPCRVVYHVDPPGEPDEVAFAYGTLASHVACGEERFTVRRDPVTDEVFFEILAFSRPAIALTRVGRPLMRRVQRRFAAAAADAISRACGDSRST